MKESNLLAASLLLALASACNAAPIEHPQQKQWQSKGGVEVPLWPAGLAIAVPDMADAGAPETTGHGSKMVAGRPWTWVGNVQRPTMTIYPPKGPNSHAALMVFPGGGYEVLAMDLKGSEVCDWATRIGMTCILPLQLHTRSEPYQLVTRHGTQLSPAARLFIEDFAQAVAPGANAQ